MLRVGMNCSAAPFGWTQDDDSNGAWPIDGTNQYVCGYDVQIARLICDTYGWDLKIIKTDWDGLIPGVVSGKLDCCISTLGVTEERLQSVDFSDYYWNNGCIMVVRKDSPYVNATSLEDFDGAKITTQIATIWEPLVQQIPNVQAEPCLSGLPELFVAVSSGKVDGIITGLSEAQSACLSNPDLTWVTFEDGKGFDVELSASVRRYPHCQGQHRAQGQDQRRHRHSGSRHPDGNDDHGSQRPAPERRLRRSAPGRRNQGHVKTQRRLGLSPKASFLFIDSLCVLPFPEISRAHASPGT